MRAKREHIGAFTSVSQVGAFLLECEIVEIDDLTDEPEEVRRVAET